MACVPGWSWELSEWDEQFASLESFVARESHSNVPAVHVEDGFRLGSWVSRQRANHLAGKLSSDRYERLACVPGWSWDRLESKWDEGFASLAKFVAREGSALVPAGHVEEGFPLGSWTAQQRVRYKVEKLQDVRIQRLEVLPQWSWNPHDYQWDEALSLLGEFVKREGHAGIPHKHIEDGFGLGQWCSVQRRRYEAGKLSDDRATRLQSTPGWKWIR